MENQLDNKLRKNLLIGIGHPLLDLTATVQKDFLKKYDLNENDAILITEKQKDLLKELLQKYEVKYTVGGSIQNTMRIIQWITKVYHLTTFFGSIGNDEFSKIMYKQVALDGVNVRYNHNNEQTGICMVLVTGNNRSLCTNPGSSKYFDFQYLATEENKILLQTAEYYYLGGFFLNVSLTTVKEIAKLTKDNRQFLFNLSAPFICQIHKEALIEIFPYIDVLFGNRSEIEALANSFQIHKGSLQEIIQVLSNWKKINMERTRLVVITQGENQVIVGKANQLLEFSVPKMETNKIIDTNGAGDAFVGGFLSQFIQKRDIEACVKCGIWAASKIIQKDGCTYDNKTTCKYI